MKETKIITCIGLIADHGIYYTSKCTFFMERDTLEYYYMKRGQKCYIGYAPELYNRKHKLQSEAGKWYVKRQCFEIVNSNGKPGVWYDNDKRMIKRVSKYGLKQFKLLNV